MRQYVVSDKLNVPKVPLSHAARVGNLIFTSGMTPFNKDRQLPGDDFATQMRQVMSNLQAALAEFGAGLEHVVKTTVVLTRISDYWEMNEIYGEYWPDPSCHPARITYAAQLASDKMLLEIEAIAEAPATEDG